ncbi:MAG: glycosyltransferase family 4 protein [Oscillospiraceae bacterium]|nr:glycosyltransferase family 4 protein [Oscillospiraceae bacterium]
MNTIRILALHLAYGGVEKAIVSMANLFAERYPVEIISVYRMPGSPAFPLDERVKVRYLLDEVPNRAEWHQAVRARKPLAILRESLRAIRILYAKKRAVRETILSIHDGTLIATRHEDDLVLSRLGDPKVWKIGQLHHDHAFKKRYLRGFRRGYCGLDVLALLTPGMVEEARRYMPEGAKTRLAYVPNFLEHFPEKVLLGKKEKTLLAVGRLEPVKGFERLLDCFVQIHARHPDWALRIVGEGSERERLERRIGELGLADRVTLTGRLDSAGVEEEMLRASIYVMTSRTEGFPFVLLEAQSCGLPTVAYDVRVGPAAVIDPGRDGYLVPDGDGAAFAERVQTLIDDRSLREEMARAAQAYSREFSREKVARIWEDVLRCGFDPAPEEKRRER